MSSVTYIEFKPLQLSSPIYSSTHLPFYSSSSLGRYCFIAAGAVVTKEVPDYAFIVGVPGKQKGWMIRHGHVLKAGIDGIMVCPESKFRYQEANSGALVCLDLNEEKPLPEGLCKGRKNYHEYK